MDVVFLFGMVIGLLLIGVPIAVSLGLSSTIFLLVYYAIGIPLGIQASYTYP